ncbi:MAG: peptidoglycan -binding protein [Rhodobacteraceae bacterium]|nr:peptidoglycan -binding protein [Paracoccaceae bacterium]
MALNRRSGQRFQASIWPGFVDAMTALLLVLIFVLTIFMVVQSIQTETISGQENQLDRLSSEVNRLAVALGTEQQRAAALEDDLKDLGVDLADARSNEAFQERLIATLTAAVQDRNDQLSDAQAQITDFEAQVAAILADRAADQVRIGDLEADLAAREDRREALETALARARDEIDAGAEAARLAAARREALEALVADLRSKGEAAEAQLQITEDQRAALARDLDAAQAALSSEEEARLADAAAAQALRDKLQASDAELTAMTLSLEAQRKEAEDTLTLLAAARDLAQQKETEALDEQAKQARLLALAKEQIAGLEAMSGEDQRRLALLNAQLVDVTSELGQLQALLDDAQTRDAAAKVQLETLGARLNAALAQAAADAKRAAALETAERERLEREARELKNYRSEFFGRLREVLGGQEGVQVVGDRFVFSSEVLFASGAAELSPAGRQEIAKLARLLQEVAAIIPPGIDWVIRVDGHTDTVPVTPGGAYRDNWELSQARALSVVRYMVDNFGFPPNRLAATGFGEFQPVDPRDTPDARARNRRIELKLTER